MGEDPKASSKKGWDILMEVSSQLREQEDSKGDLKNTGEARALNRMKNALQREIGKDATEFLKRNGFTSQGLKKPVKRRGR